MTSRILAIANQKGGVGKTTTAVNLATSLAAVGKSVLLIDLDPQGNASTGLGIDRKARAVSSYDLLFGDVGPRHAATQTRVPGLWVVPASLHLAGADIELVTAERREYRLREALRGVQGAQDAGYDYILIDCPPSLSLITLNALIAADAVLVPLQCEFYALEGLSQLVRTIDRVKAHFNPQLEIQGVVLTMYDRRNKLSEQVAADVRAFFGPKVYTTIIPRNVRVSEAPSHGLPAIVYDMGCPGSQAYIHLAKEMLRRERVQAEAVAA
ncbi:MAG: ParA family protein [Rhodospirillales bacterium]|nr:ParA family protein [Alphaproteobacteria bacterium]MCB9986623.1 ParA family protein [Rhodospirillales bacterium]USO06847.1 MAG: ParA family protein [Rhodospirillales bacterium]